ncbi:MAG: phosphomannomutase/phosphoglucomutase, partial [Cellvibrionales bacterium]|nr:phosphomannomutase/phosphoglucomutase [Cellvibrionales bacterium]
MDKKKHKKDKPQTVASPLIQIVAFVAAPIIIITLALLALLKLQAWPSFQHEQDQQLARALINDINGQLTQRLQSTQKQLDFIANNNPYLTQPLTQLDSLNNPQDPFRLEKRKKQYQISQAEAKKYLTPLFPDLVDIRLLPQTTSGSAGLKKLDISLNNTIELLMFSKVTLGKAQPAEVYKVGKDFRVTFASPITKNNRIVGVLLASFSTKLLQELFEQPPALLSGLSVTDSSRSPVIKAGNLGTQAMSQQSPLPDTEITVSIKPYTPTIPSIILISIAALALFALVAFITFWLLQTKWLRQDQAKIIQRLHTLSSLHDAKAPNLTLPTLSPLLDAIQSMAGNIKKSHLAQTPDPATESQAPVQKSALTFNEKVFRDYDIRGRADIDITSDLAFHIGRAIATKASELNHKHIVVGRDARLSSPALTAALMEGITNSGCDVIDIGIVPTPLVYFAAKHLNTDAAVMVTASHNNKEDNGFKIVLDGKSIGGDAIHQLKNRIKSHQYNEGKGQITEDNTLPNAYTKAIQNDVIPAKPLKVVLDAANGSGGPLAIAALKAIDCEVIPLFCEMDGSFPNHAPDPSQLENLTQLIAQVKQERADIGIALDGDADRVIVITSQGNVLYGDQLMMLFASQVAATNPGASIIYDVKCSRHLADVITDAGARAIMQKTGHSNIKQKMRETNAILGGEYTGHFCFNDRWMGFDDGIYAAARLIELLSMSHETLEEKFAQLPTSIRTEEILIPLAPAQDKFQIIKKLVDHFQKTDAELITIDGVRLEYPYSFGLVRASNTNHTLTARFEAD